MFSMSRPLPLSESTVLSTSTASTVSSSPSWLIKGAIAAVVVGGVVYLLWSQTQKYRRPKSMVAVLAKSDTKTARDMVEQLQKLGLIKDKRVAQTMLKVDRAHYVPLGCEHPYKELAVPLGFNATISAPHMHAIGLDILSPCLTNGASVLDVGCGSGYISACLANLVAPAGRVFGVDHVPELVERAKANIQKDNPLLFGMVTLAVGDGFQGMSTYAPFDAIYVGAACPAIPEALIHQLKPGGKLVLPVGPPDGFHNLVAVDKKLDGTIVTTNMGPVRFVPLTSYEKQIEGGEVGMTKVVKGQNGEDLLLRPQYYPAPDTTPAEIKIMKVQLTRQLA